MASSILADLAISESGFVFDPHSGMTFTVNPTGRVVLERIRAGGDRADVLEALTEAFDVGERERDLARDLDEFVHLLRGAGVVPRDFALE